MLLEAVVKTIITWQIDGRINKTYRKALALAGAPTPTSTPVSVQAAIYESPSPASAPAFAGHEGSRTAGKDTDTVSNASFISWRDIRSQIRELIRGKTTPEALRFQLVLDMDAAADGPFADITAGLPDNYLYIMRIDFDETALRIVTSAEAVNAGIFDPAGKKEACALWDTVAEQLLNTLGIESERL